MLQKEVAAKAKVGENHEQASAEFSYPETTSEAVESYGEELALDLIHSALTLQVQRFIRQYILAGRAAELQAAAASFRPGRRSQKVEKDVGAAMRDNLLALKAAGREEEARELFRQMFPDLA